MRRRYRQSKATRKNYERRGHEVRRETLPRVEWRDSLAHRDRDFLRIQQTADRHRNCHQQHSKLHVERLDHEQQCYDLRRVVQATREAHGSGAKEMHDIKSTLHLSTEELSFVLLPAMLYWTNRYLGNSNGCERKQARGLWNRNVMHNLINADAPFFLHSQLDPNSTRRDVTHHSQTHCKQRTGEQWQKEQGAERTEVDARADRSQTSSDKRADQRVCS